MVVGGFFVFGQDFPEGFSRGGVRGLPCNRGLSGAGLVVVVVLPGALARHTLHQGRGVRFFYFFVRKVHCTEALAYNRCIRKNWK